MTAVRRWVLVALGVILLVALPALVGALPARSSDLSAAQVLAKVKASSTVAYSGYAESVGGLALPITDQFTDLTDLLGQRTRVRVWWLDDENWRADTVDPTGENDIAHDSTGTWTWEYESAQATRTPEAVVRLPRTADLLPSELGRRLLSEATAAEVSRLPAARIAGRDALGLRLQPSDARSTVARVDVWVDSATGLPLRVEAFGDGVAAPAMTTSFLDLTVTAPTAAEVRFSPPPGATIQSAEVPDLAAAADRFAPVTPPDSLAGLARRQDEDGLGAVGVYGRGVTLLVAVPLRSRDADPLRTQLRATPGAVVDDAEGVTVQVGPLVLQVTEGRAAGDWLLAGTVTQKTLTAAAAQLSGFGPAQR